MNLTSPESLIFWMTLFFLIFFFLLTKFGWKPILQAVKERERSIEEALDEAERVKQEMAKLKADNEKLLQEARQQREQILKEARELKEQMLAEARSEAEKQRAEELNKTRQIIEAERQAALKDIHNQVAQIAVEMAEKVLRGQLDDKDRQVELIKKNLKELNLN
ncbi:MAG: F0F1 ATP synthase subunit B [Chlorobi bacterium]|nr:F0F1 ATP synthase subunit B [Chlorobiota bacterium]